MARRPSVLLSAGIAVAMALFACKRQEPATTVIKVDDEGVVMNGSRINVVLAPDKKQNVPPLFELLRADLRSDARARLVEVYVPADLAVGPGVSVVATAASAGHPQLTVHSGELTMKLDYWTRGTSDLEPRELVHVESEGASAGGFVVRFGGAPSPRLGHRHKVADRAEAAKVIAREWNEPAGTPPRGLVLRVPSGTFREALVLAQGLLALPELAGSPVAFEIGAPAR